MLMNMPQILVVPGAGIEAIADHPEADVVTTMVTPLEGA